MGREFKDFCRIWSRHEIMWEQGTYDNAGGFYEPTQGGAGTPGGGEKKRQRAQNLVAVKVRTILDCGDDGLKIEGLEVGMVSIAGQILKIEHSETKSTFTLEDNSGTIEAVQWNDESTASASELQEVGVVEGTKARVVGSVRSQQDKRYVMLFRILPLTCDEEMDAHYLEVEHNKLL